MIIQATVAFDAKDGLTEDELTDALSDVEIHLECVGVVHSKAMGGEGRVHTITATMIGPTQSGEAT